jgi:hypothetical protein
MSVRSFENGYWYQTELVEFGKQLGLAAAHRMRKNELESAISAYLANGRLPKTTSSKPLKKGVKDLDKGLTLALPIANYTGNKVTKGFIRREAKRKNSEIQEKSRVWYRLNRWREANVAKRTVTYGELIDQYVALNSLERFKQIPHPRYVNFLADYSASEKGASREDAIAAWKQLKKMDVPKTYQSWRVAARKKTARE